MDTQFSSYPRAKMSDFMSTPVHSATRSERERLDSVTQLVSTITLVAQSINSAYRRDNMEGDRLVACVVELSRRALADVRAWPTRGNGSNGLNGLMDTGCDAAAVISHALSRAMMPTPTPAVQSQPSGISAAFAPASLNAEANHTMIQAQDRMPEDGHKLLQSLTARERDMLQLIAKGMSNKEIANCLHLTEGTVKGYVSHMLSKLGVADRTQAALFAVRHDVQ